MSPKRMKTSFPVKPGSVPDKKRTLFVFVSAVSAVSGFAYVPLYYSQRKFADVLICLLVGVAALLAPSIWRRLQCPWKAVSYLAAVEVVTTTLTILNHGGIYSQEIAWLVTIPLSVFLIAGEWPARLWSFICLFVLFVFTLLEMRGIHLQTLPEQHQTAMLNGTCYFGIVITLCVLPCAVLIKRWTGSPRSTSHYVSFNMTVLCISIALLNGSLKNQSLVPRLASVPLGALLISSVWLAWIWSGICVTLAVLFVNSLLGSTLFPGIHNGTSGPNFFHESSYLGAILFISLLGIVFEYRRQQAVRAMNRALEELAQANKHLQATNLEKNEIIAMVAHDLRAPIGAISWFAEQIVTEITAPPCEIVKWGVEIDAASQRMISLLDGVLKAHILDEGKIKVNPERCNFAELVARVVENHLYLARRKDISLQWSPPDQAAAPFVHADPLFIPQILDNLISNAIKYSPPGSAPIVIRLRNEAKTWELDVEDSGPGLSTGDQSRLFSKFARLTPRPTGGESSTGLGLSIAKRMAEMMRGTLSCQSTLGKGSIFTLSLPKAKAGE